MASSRTTVLQFAYKDRPWALRVDDICWSWERTPYKLNACKKKAGVDCIHFVAAVLDELYGVEHSKNLKSLPPDACVHNKEGVLAAGRALFEAYPHQRVEDKSIEAGDLVLLGPPSTKTTSHLLIASTHGRLWQSTKTPLGVLVSGYGINEDQMLVAVYRATDKEKWLR